MATYISAQTGNWTSVSTWLTAETVTGPTAPAGKAPQSFGLDKIVIRSPHTVTYNTSGVFGDGGNGNNAGTTTQNIATAAIILSGGCLRASRTVNTALTALGIIWIAGDSVSTSGSFWDWGTASDPVSAVTATISMSGVSLGACGMVVKGSSSSLTLTNSACFWGLEKTRNTFLTLSAEAGQPVITVDNAYNWNTNDELVIESDTISTTRALTGIRIQSINGNNITLNTNLNFARLSGTRVGNFTSTVTYETLPSSQMSFGIIVEGLFLGNYQFGYISLRDFGSYWRDTVAPYIVATQGAIHYNAAYNKIQPPFKGIAYTQTRSSAVNYASLSLLNPGTDELLIDDFAFNGGPNLSTNQGIYFGGNSFAKLTNSVFYRSFNSIWPVNTLKTTINNCNINSENVAIGINTGANNGIRLAITNSKIRSNNSLMMMDNFLNTEINNCNITTSPTSITRASTNAFGTTTLTNCTLSGPSYTIGSNIRTIKDFNFNIFNANNDSNYITFNYYHYAQANSFIRKNGITSFAITPKASNEAFSKIFTVPAVRGVTQKIKGNLRFDSNYGTATPPSITFGGAVSNTTFTCPAVANTWHSFEYDLTPNITGDIELTITGQSVNTNGFVYLDGLMLDPFVTNVRFYGFEVDKNSYRTIDTLTTLTENQVSAYPYINNLDYVYDESRYWTVTNPTSSYIDLVNNVGTTLDFSNKGILLNSAALSSLNFDSNTNILTLSTFNLSAGNIFNTIQTTGGISIDDNSNISNITLVGSVSGTTARNLNDVIIDGTLTYNTNVDSIITYTNCNIGTVQNNGSGIVTINRLNSNVDVAGRNVVLLDNPTYINISNLLGGYVAIFDNNDTLRYYRSTDGQIILPSGSQGVWSYKIGKYGFKTISGQFSTGTTVNIIPPYAQNIDTNILETNVSLVSTYNIFNNTQDIYDYFSYYRTTSSGLTFPQFYAYRNTLDILTNDLILDPIASIPFSYDGSTFTIKSTKIEKGLLVRGIETTNNIYLSGSASLSSINIKSNKLMLGSVFDLNSVNAESNLTYNTDNPFDIYYTNCTIKKVENLGDGDIKIKKLNSTIVDGTDAQIFDFYPTYLNLNLNLGTIAIYDNSLTPVRKYFTTTNQTIELPYEADGLWSYRITKYGQRTVEGNFTVNRNIGNVFDITPTFQPDIYVYSPLNIVSAYNTFNTIQSIYDYMSFYKTTSNGIDYGDLTNVGSILDIINNRSLILDITSPSLFTVTSNSITLSSNLLSSGVGYAVNFLKTTNNIYLSGNSTLQSMSVQGNIYQENVSNLLGMVVDGTIRYYLNTPPLLSKDITYTNCNVNKVVNDGDRDIVITRINSFISDATDAEIITVVPISINIDVDPDTYVAIYKPNGDRYHYGSGDTTLILGGNAVTGDWTYKAVKYGYLISSGSFFIDKDVSSVSTVSPTLIVDSSITVTDVNTVIAYTDLNTNRKIYDYLAYYKTTIDGIDYGDIATRALGAIIFNKGLILDKTSASMVSVDLTNLTIKSSKIDEDFTIYSSGDFVLSNGSEITDKVRIRASNIDSELIVIGITELILYPSLDDRDKDTLRGPIITGNIFRFKYNTTVDGVLLKDILYVRARVGSYLLSTFPISEGNNVVDLGTFGQIQQVLFNQTIINDGVKKSSRLIPHSTNL